MTIHCPHKAFAPSAESVPAPRTADAALRSVATASTAHNSRVHLVNTPFTGRTLCRLDIARLCPPDHFLTRPCAECLHVAGAADITVARERNTLINLQRVRVPSTRS